MADVYTDITIEDKPGYFGEYTPEGNQMEINFAEFEI